VKACSKCKIEQPYDNFSLTNFDKPFSQCRDCQNEAAKKRYYDKKAKLNIVTSEDSTDCFPSEKHSVKERKCKDLFFYLHA
jgi:hypothetical protein